MHIYIQHLIQSPFFVPTHLSIGTGSNVTLSKWVPSIRLRKFSGKIMSLVTLFGLSTPKMRREVCFF